MGWKEGTCGCFRDFGSCLLIFCVPGGYCCAQGKAIEMATKEGCFIPCMLPMCCACIGGAINRGKIRAKYDIGGNFIKDCLCHLFCAFCAASQEYREAKERGK